MGVDRLALTDFRSWHHLLIDFSPAVNVLVGANGVGKTNIVEALEFLSVGSSHRAHALRWLVRRGAARATVRANTRSGDTAGPASGEVRPMRLQATIPLRGAVRARLNDGPSKYFGDIAGLLKAVFFSPADEQLVSGAPILRRSFLNQTAILMNPGYFRLMQAFRHSERQRAAMLKLLQKGFNEPHGRGAVLGELEAWTAQFTDLGLRVTRERQKAVKELSPIAGKIYASLSGGQSLTALYHPSFAEVGDSADPKKVRQAIASHFQRLYAGEVARGSSLIGPQRDELDLLLGGQPARETASNGEMWTIALALRMAQYRWLSERGPKPLLILDDVFSQLDEHRRTQILDFAKECGQVFITVAAQSDIPGGLPTPPGRGSAHERPVRVIDVGSLARKDEQADDPQFVGVSK